MVDSAWYARQQDAQSKRSSDQGAERDEHDRARGSEQTVGARAARPAAAATGLAEGAAAVIEQVQAHMAVDGPGPPAAPAVRARSANLPRGNIAMAAEQLLHLRRFDEARTPSTRTLLPR